ncbi:hypothetical protein R1sor_024437 [Riccia sorocarpa]|uniref:DUF4371 domain-containing protein n=1 Tax=Riccia sorocarpa TaxID=122646 RepID=A0ABD3GSD9_9MARC
MTVAQASPFFGVMIDESMDVSVTGHLVVFFTYLEVIQVRTCFAGLLELQNIQHVKRLPSQIRGNQFHSVVMTRDMDGLDLHEALTFQKAFTEAVILALQERFEDNTVMRAFRILSPPSVPSQSSVLRNWGLLELESLCSHFGFPRNVHGD